MLSIIFYQWSSLTAPTSVETLTTDDAISLLEELLPAQTHSYLLGLRLGLPVHVVDGIFAAHLHPRDRLLHILIAFLNQEGAQPTWGTVVQALRSPAVSLFQLANKLEATHISDSTATARNAPTTTTGTLVHFLLCDSTNYIHSKMESTETTVYEAGMRGPTMASSTGIILYMSQCGIIATQVHFVGNDSSLKVATIQLASSRPESPIPGIYSGTRDTL